VQFASYCSGKVKKSARQTDTIPPAVHAKEQTFEDKFLNYFSFNF